MYFRKTDIFEHSLPAMKAVAILSVVVFTSYTFWAFDSDEEKKKAIILKQNTISAQIIERAKEDALINEEALLLLNERVLTHQYEIAQLKECIDFNLSRSWSLDLARECDTFEVKDFNKEAIKEVVKSLSPDELFYTTKVSDKCYVSQTEREHKLEKNGWMLATDVACWFKAEVYAPDYLSESFEYEVKVKNDNLLWDYVELVFEKKWQKLKWVIWHTRTKLKDWDKIKTWVRIWEMNLSWATTWYHTHIELWTLVVDNWTNITYTTSNKVLDNKRNNVYDTPKWNTIFLTTYDLWSVSQNDSSPCVGASWKDLCKLAEQWVQTIALTVDMRNKMWIKFWDNIVLTSKDNKSYKVQVHDEMNKRFRYSCVKKEWVCIKWDIARYQWKAELLSWVYSIKTN